MLLLLLFIFVGRIVRGVINWFYGERYPLPSPLPGRERG